VPQVWEIECLDGQIASCWQNRRKDAETIANKLAAVAGRARNPDRVSCSHWRQTCRDNCDGELPTVGGSIEIKAVVLILSMISPGLVEAEGVHMRRERDAR